MSVFAEAIDDLFGDANLAQEATWRAAGTASPVVVRVVLRQPDRIESFGETRIRSETTRLDLRTTEVQNPRPGDTIEIPGSGPGQAGQTLVVQGEPVRDPERLIWTLDVRPQ